MRPDTMNLPVLRSQTAVPPEAVPWWSSPFAGCVELPHAPATRGASPWTLLRVVEPAFPSDAFAQATQFEHAHRSGLVGNSVDLAAFVREALWEVGPSTLRYVRATHADPAAFAEIDTRCDAGLRDPRARRVSSENGQVFLTRAAPLSGAISQLVHEARRRHLAGHLAPAFGAVAGLLGAEGDDASRLFLFLGARGIVAAAVRLGLLGAAAGYLALSAATPTVNALIQNCRGGAVGRPAREDPPERGAPRSAPTPPRPTPLPIARISLRAVRARRVRVNPGDAAGAPLPGPTPPRRAPAGAEAPPPVPPAARAPPPGAGTLPAAPRSTA
jgi:urease accessory protein